MELLLAIPQDVILPLHPRTRARLEAAGLMDRLRGRRAAPSEGYLDFTSLLVHARAVLTDSGGVQKQAYLAGVPCVTLRREWTETVDAGWNVLVDSTPTPRWPRWHERRLPSAPSVRRRAGSPRVVSSLSA